MGCSKPGSFAFENIGSSGETGLLAHPEMLRLEAWLVSHQNILAGGWGEMQRACWGQRFQREKCVSFGKSLGIMS